MQTGIIEQRTTLSYEQVRIGDEEVLLGYVPGVDDPVARVTIARPVDDKTTGEAFRKLVDDTAAYLITNHKAL